MRCAFTLDVGSMRMCRPAHGSTELQDTPARNAIIQALSEARAIHARFNEVRRVVAWLNKHATPGAARYYFPTIRALLPNETHSVHEAAGQRFKEPSENVGPIIPAMRSASTTIAGALLCHEGDIPGPSFCVQFEPLGALASRSQHLVLL
jgi:hypothetical protein